MKAAKRLKQKNEKETSNKVSEAVNDIEKKLLENRRLKGGTNLFRRKGKQSVLSKKSFSFDDLRTTGTCLDSASQAKAKIPIRRCRVLQESGDNQRIDSLTHCRSNAASDSILLEKKNPGVSNLWAKENSAHVEPPRDALKSCLRNGDSNENHIDLRLIKARTLAPDKGPIGNLKLQRTGLSGVVGHRVLRKALRDSAMGVSSFPISSCFKRFLVEYPYHYKTTFSSYSMCVVTTGRGRSWLSTISYPLQFLAIFTLCHPCSP